MNTIGIFTVATNKYLSYWQEMVRTFDYFAGSKWDCTFYVFTDNPEKATEFGQTLKHNSKVNAVKIPNYGWPDATILRFELIESIVKSCTENVLMHLDADMEVHAPFDEQFNSENWKSGIFLVGHPGFYKQYLKTQTGTKFSVKIIEKIKQVLGSKYPIHPLGAWESRRESSAFVDSAARKVYVCGATWGGVNAAFQEMVRRLANQTRSDRDKNVMAEWHDESHLNRWASENSFQLLDPSYCYAEPFSDNAGLTKIILAVDKGENSTRT